jgi:hypothetical protein
MLYTRNAFHFRKFYKEEVARESGYIDLNFVGSLHPDKKRRETGFSKLIYGNREDLGKLFSYRLVSHQTKYIVVREILLFVS